MTMTQEQKYTELPKHSVVAYHGGGYEGCFWEWNFAYVDQDGEFHDIYSSGYAGIHDGEELLDKLNGRPHEFDIYDMSDESERDRLADEESVWNAGRVAGYFEENDFGVKITLKCDCCEHRVRAEGCHAEGLHGAGGLHVEAGEIICPDCHNAHTCWYCGEFYNDDLVHHYDDDEGNKVELNGQACEWCASRIKEGEKEDETIY